MPPIGWYAVVLGAAAVATAAACLPAAWLSRRIGYVALPDERRVHSRATPYGGGAAMFLGFLVAVIVAAEIPQLRPIFRNSSEPLGVVLAAAAIFGVGLVDDAREMSAPAKIAGQVLAASILYFLGVTLYFVKVPLGSLIGLHLGGHLGGVIALSPGITPLIMALWVIALANAVNLIDGLDGLAAGVVAIGGGALAVYSLKLMATGVLGATNIGPLVAVVACGVCLGFLPFNFHPAKMFMGDAGALLLGLLMSASTMVVGGRIPPLTAPHTTGITYFFFAPLLIPLFILGVPIVDMAFAFIRRTARGTGFHTPDKDHIHHRLLRLGHGHRRSVVILWAWTALLSGFILFPLFVHRVNAFIPFGVAALAIALYTFFHPDLRHRGAAEPGGRDPAPSTVAAPSGVAEDGVDGGEAAPVPTTFGAAAHVVGSATRPTGLVPPANGHGPGPNGRSALGRARDGDRFAGGRDQVR